MSNVIDLDILQPEKTEVILAGKTIDVSFVPCGITFEVDDIVQKLHAIPLKEIQKGKKEC
jgi:hypothetical protein